MQNHPSTRSLEVYSAQPLPQCAVHCCPSAISEELPTERWHVFATQREGRMVFVVFVDMQGTQADSIWLQSLRLVPIHRAHLREGATRY